MVSRISPKDLERNSHIHIKAKTSSLRSYALISTSLHRRFPTLCFPQLLDVLRSSLEKSSEIFYASSVSFSNALQNEEGFLANNLFILCFLSVNTYHLQLGCWILLFNNTMGCYSLRIFTCFS